MWIEAPMNEDGNKHRSVRNSPGREVAVLAGGCFWGMQDLFGKLPCVINTGVGYTGGDVPNATYRNHGSHAEAIEIEFDPTHISYRDLLEFFFQIHDPTTLNRQGKDAGLSRADPLWLYLPLPAAWLETAQAHLGYISSIL